MKKKEETVWAICTGKIILPFLIQRTRKEAIQEYEKWLGESWSGAKDRGYTVKKCAIRIV